MQARDLVPAAVLSVALALGACSKSDKPEPAAAAAPAPSAESAPTSAPAPAETPSPTGNEAMAMQKIDLAPGTGAEIQIGDDALVHYTGWLYDAAAPENKGKKFDSSVDRNEPFEFPVGAGRVIKGWDQGVIGMKVGGKRRLVIPPDMAYGNRDVGNGLIPPGSTLVFDVEIVEIHK